MLLTRYPVPALLTDAVESIWTFESSDGLPANALNMSVATGKAKLLLSVGSLLTVQIPGQPGQFIVADSLNVVGLTTQPVYLTSHGPLRLISVEFAAGLAGRFFRVSLPQFTNAVWPAEAALGATARLLERQLLEQSVVSRQVELLTEFLSQTLLPVTGANPMVEYAVKAIRQQNGLLNLGDLCQQSGYSQRYVDRQFLAHVGVTPKLFARIIRFQSTYRQLIKKPGLEQADLYQTYYDQSHYIHEFRRFAGCSPGRYVRQLNSFGELFYP